MYTIMLSNISKLRPRGSANEISHKLRSPAIMTFLSTGLSLKNLIKLAEIRIRDKLDAKLNILNTRTQIQDIYQKEN